MSFKVNTNPAKLGPEILSLHSEGLSVRDIAKILDTSTQNVYAHLSRRGLKGNKERR